MKFGTAEGQNRLEPPVVVFEYKLENPAGWERCAASVLFESFRKVTVVAHFAAPLD